MHLAFAEIAPALNFISGMFLKSNLSWGIFFEERLGENTTGNLTCESYGNKKFSFTKKRGIIKQKYIRKKAHPRYELTEIGKIFRQIFIGSEICNKVD